MNKNGKICSKITSKNIPRGEKEVGSRLKMEREKFISLSLSLPHRMRRSREQLYPRIKCSSPQRIVQNAAWFSFVG